MKKLIYSTTIFLVLFAVGCKENSLTDPLTVEPTNKVQPNPSHQGTITLERMLTDPYPVMNSYFIINGAIEYEHTLVTREPVPPETYVSLNLSISAELTYLCTVCGENYQESLTGYISSITHDEIFVSEEGVLVLEKSFSIQGREDGMYLVCRFIVTTNGIELDTMWLELAYIQSANTTSQ